jgi:aspartyl-tRNA(Asn)/glutamyl-tRNA(Gln) amidotransferase subunit B
MGDVMRELNHRKLTIGEFPVSPDALSELIALVTKGTINTNTGKDVFAKMVGEGKSASEIVKDEKLEQISDESSLSGIVDVIIAAQPDEAARYRAGEKKLTGFFVGQVMKKTQGQANPKLVNQLLREKLG